jgi:effector-binding domain-containing protein
MPEYRMVDVEEQPYLYNERSCSMNPGDISKAMEGAFTVVGNLVGNKGITSVINPLSVYYTHDEQKMTFRAGFLVSAEDAAKAEGDVKADVLPAGRVLNYIHRGPYATLRIGYGEMMQYLEDNDMVVSGPTWEVYIKSPDSGVSEDEYETDIYVTVAAT